MSTVIEKKIIIYFVLNIILVFLFGSIYWGCQVIFNYLYWKYPKFMYKYRFVFFDKYNTLKNYKADYRNLKNPSFNDIWHLDELDYWIWISLITQSTIGYGGIVERSGPVPYRNLSYPFRFFNLLQGFSVIALPIIVALLDVKVF